MNDHHRRAAAVAALFAIAGTGAGVSAGAGIGARAGAADAAAAPIVPLSPGRVIHGGIADARLEVKATGDVDGDGAADLFLNHWSQRGTRRASQVVVALGRAEWPDLVARSALAAVHDLGFPDRKTDQLNDDTFELEAVRDLDGDGLDDIAIEVNERSQGETDAVEVRVFRGRRPFTGLNVQSGRPDFVIRQDNPPRTPQQERTQAMPDEVFAGDFDGDGDHDLVVASCAAGGVRYESEQVGALRIYWSDAAGPKTIALARKPDVAIHGQPGLQLGCFGADVADLDADGRDDLVLYGSGLATFSGSHGAVLYGRADWPASGEVEDLADLTFGHDGDEAGLRIVGLVEANGDGRPDILAEFGTVRTVEGQCLWFTAGRPTGRRTTTRCDLRFTGLPADHWADVDADGQPDLVYAAHRLQGSDAPFAWRIRFGPLASGAHHLSGRDDDGDATVTVPYGEGAVPEWRFADVSGDGRIDLLQSRVQAPAPDGAENAGAVELHLGPLVDRAAVPTAVPPTPSPAPTAAATAHPSSAPPTATGVAPTAEATPPAAGRILLPIAHAGAAR